MSARRASVAACRSGRRRIVSCGADACRGRIDRAEAGGNATCWRRLDIRRERRPETDPLAPLTAEVCPTPDPPTHGGTLPPGARHCLRPSRWRRGACRCFWAPRAGCSTSRAILLGGGLAGYGWSWARERRAELAERLSAARRRRRCRRSGRSCSGASQHQIDLARLRTERVLPPASEAMSAGESCRRASRRRSAHCTDQDKVPAGPDWRRQAGLYRSLIELEAPHMSVSSIEEAVQAYPRLAARINQLAAMEGFGAPASGASGGRISVALPETARPRVFDPPSGVNAKECRKAPVAHARCDCSCDQPCGCDGVPPARDLSQD